MIGLGRLSNIVRRNGLTFDRIRRLTNLEWKEMGFDKTEQRLITSQMGPYLNGDRDLKQEALQRLQQLKSQNLQKRKEKIAVGPSTFTVPRSQTNPRGRVMDSSPLFTRHGSK